MRGLLSILMLLTAIIAVTNAYRPPVHRPGPNNPGFPSFPGQGPYNPKPTWPKPYPQYRRRRSDDKNSQIDAHAQKEGGKTSYNVDLGHKVYENEHGSINVYAGVRKEPRYDREGEVGINGKFHFG